jgi:hypothetical protein
MRLHDEDQAINYLLEYVDSGKDRVRISTIVVDEDTKQVKTKTRLYTIDKAIRWGLQCIADEGYFTIDKIEVETVELPKDKYPQLFVFGSPRSTGMSEYYKYMESKE